jgi:Flp pilus assembly pilin Flp
MTALFKNFATSESGAVTVDWVVLTAAIVGLGLAVMAVVSGGVEDLSNDISSSLTDIDPVSDPFENNN